MQKRTYSIFAIGIFIFVTALFLLVPSESKDQKNEPSQQAMRSWGNTSTDTQTTASNQLHKSSTNLLSPLPEAPIKLSTNTDITLWDDLQDAKPIKLDGVPALSFQVDASSLEQLAVGQKLHVASPHGNGQVTAELSNTRNQLNNVEVWSGKIEGGNASDMMIVTRGKFETHVVITTSEGIVTTIINNQTGQASLIDEADYVSNQLPVDDGISVEPIDDTPPAHLTQLTEFAVGSVSNNAGEVR